MRFTLTFLSLLCYISAVCQPNINITNDRKKNGYILYASNDAPCPVTISLNLVLENLSFSGSQSKFFVIPAKATKFRIGELDAIEPRDRNKFTFNFRSNYGDANLASYDTEFEYDLPFQKGKSYLLFQGYDGLFSHQNENSLDFLMPEGSEVVAARDGIVIKVIQTNTESCPRAECKKYTNVILVYHSDGTFAVYAHLKVNGSVVKEGDIVKNGDLIGYSGNTGFSTGPHLHFSCFVFGNFDTVKTVKTKFKLGDGMKTGYLQEKVKYSKEY